MTYEGFGAERQTAGNEGGRDHRDQPSVQNESRAATALKSILQRFDHAEAIRLEAKYKKLLKRLDEAAEEVKRFEVEELRLERD